MLQLSHKNSSQALIMTIYALIYALEWELDYNYSYEVRMMFCELRINDADKFSDNVY